MLWYIQEKCVCANWEMFNETRLNNYLGTRIKTNIFSFIPIFVIFHSTWKWNLQNTCWLNLRFKWPTYSLKYMNIIYIYIYSSANKIFAVLRRNRSDPLSRAMGCVGELRAGSRPAGYERFGTGNLAPLAVLVPIPKPATHSKGASNQHPHCTVYIWMYHVGSHWIAVKICTGQQVNSQTSFS